jgi:hypothetical protein
MNPKSGGGKVGKFDLKRKAEDLGAEVFLMSGLNQSTSLKWLARPWPGGAICLASLGATAGRPWRPAWPPSTVSRSW